MTTFAEQVEDYLRLRRALGFKLREHGRLLPKFAAQLDAVGADFVTVELALAWAIERTVTAGSVVPAMRLLVVPRIRPLPRRDRPADRDPALRADPARAPSAAAVHLHR